MSYIKTTLGSLYGMAVVKSSVAPTTVFTPGRGTGSAPARDNWPWPCKHPANRNTNGTYKKPSGWMYYLEAGGSSVCSKTWDPTKAARTLTVMASGPYRAPLPSISRFARVGGKSVVKYSLNSVYATKLLEALGNPDKQAIASSRGVDWESAYSHPKMTASKNEVLSAADVSSGVRYLQQATGLYWNKRFDKVKTILPPNEQAVLEKEFQKFLAFMAATFYLMSPTFRKKSVRPTREHRAEYCEGLVSPRHQECCAQALKSGFDVESYKEAIRKNDPRVTNCFSQTDSAIYEQETNKKLILAAGVLGAALVGVMVLKGGKKKR